MTKIGLVLSSGGFKGLAHIGVLKALEENNIKISAIAGCSMGAIIGAYYAAGKTPEEIEEFSVKQTFRSVLNFSISKLGLDKLTKMKELIEEFTGVTKFRQLKIPLYINATNITQKKEVVFHHGELFRAIRASIAIPGIFAPLKIRNDYYVDGGVLNNLPVSILPKKIKKYIIVDAIAYEKQGRKEILTIKGVMEQSILTGMKKLTEIKLEKIPKEDYVMIKPKTTTIIIPNELKFRHTVREGELATWKKMPEIKRKLL